MREPRNTPATRKGKWSSRQLFLLSCLSCVSWLFPLSGSVASAADPLYLSRPYDEITLDENNVGVRLKVLPLKLPGRKLPAADDRTDDLEIELLDRPGERFRLGWNNIVGIKFFEELVLAEAEVHVKGQRFDEAYPYFQFLETRFPATTGLKEAVENYLWAQIGADFTAGKNDAALALLIELHQRNPQRQGMATAFEKVTVKLADERIAAENYRAARGLLANLTRRYPSAAEAAAKFEAQMRDKAAATLNAARESLAAGKFREAHQSARQALGIWPAVEGGRELVQEVHQKYPVVSVGVTSAAGASGWATQRTGPLIAPPPFELTLAADGEVSYRSRFVQLAESKDPRQIILKLPADSRVTAQDLAKSFIAAADAQQRAFDPAWADLLAGSDVRSQDELLFTLNRPPLRAEAWLQVPLAGAGSYRQESQTPEQTIFARQSPGMSAGSVPPMEIIEHPYADSAAALRALKRGEISAVDRVSPWELKELAENKQIVVGRYALPSVHVLIPSPRKGLAANRTLKRAILYGIDRQSILARSLLAGQTIAGCSVVSGPFPRGASKNDPHGYAYNEEVAVRPYDPGLALALAKLTNPEGQKLPPLLLAHPAEEIPRVACQSIARQLDAVGIPVELREFSTAPLAGNDLDLLYVELPMHEPLVDVWRLLGRQGMAGPPTLAMLLDLRELEAAADWQQASNELKAIHRLAAAELPVIPLWQLVDHFANQSAVKGIGQRPVSLYQDIDQWQVELTLPSE